MEYFNELWVVSAEFSLCVCVHAGSQSVLEVVTVAFQRLCEELEPSDLDLMGDCLYEEITDAVSNRCSLHLSHLLSLLISTVQIGYIQKIYGGLQASFICLFLFYWL